MRVLELDLFAVGGPSCGLEGFGSLVGVSLFDLLLDMACEWHGQCLWTLAVNTISSWGKDIVVAEQNREYESRALLIGMQQIDYFREMQYLYLYVCNQRTPTTTSTNCSTCTLQNSVTVHSEKKTFPIVQYFCTRRKRT
jgi:hypothetical protein